MGNRNTDLPLSVIRHYLNTGDSIRKTAERWKIHYTTVFKWLKRYKKEGEIGFLSTYHRPWNRTKNLTERKIVMLKERDPRLTVRKAQEILRNEGIMISLKGIWNTWRRYGCAGFDKSRLDSVITKCIPWSKEAEKKYNQARWLFEAGNVAEAAEILNSIPSLPENDLINQIPDQYLSLQRRIEKYIQLFKKIPLPEYISKMESIYNECVRNELYFSLLKIGILQGGALSFLGERKAFSAKIKELTDILKPRGNYFSYLLFLFKYIVLIGQGIAKVRLFDYNGGYRIIKQCQELMRHRKYLPAEFMALLGTVYTWVQDYRRAEYWFLKALNSAPQNEKSKYEGLLSIIIWHKGEYKKVNVFKKTELQKWGDRATSLFFEAVNSLIDGKPESAIALSTDSLKFAKREQLNDVVSGVYLIIASAHSTLGRKEEAIKNLKGIYYFSQRSRHWGKIISLVVSNPPEEKLIKIVNGNFLPLVKIAALLRIGNYRRAFALAKRKYLIPDFLLLVPFFPELVISNIEKGKLLGVPKTMLRLPVFNRAVLVYNLRFLGKLVVYRNEEHLKINLRPKDVAFLIHFALRADSPGKKVLVDDFCYNFWPGSSNAFSNLSHLLVRIRRALKLPGHLLEVLRIGGDSYLVNQGIYFVNDYSEFGHFLKSAKAFMEVGKWEFGFEHFLMAFKLFRGEPFKRNFDEWSLNMRFRILNELENEAIIFARAFLEHGDKRDVKKVLEKVLKIIPDSKEISSLLTLISNQIL